MVSSLLASTFLLMFGQSDGSALLAKHDQTLREAQSLKVSFTVQRLPAAPQECTLTFSRPGLIRIETPTELRITDGKTIWEYDKQSNTYTEAEGGINDAIEWLKEDDVYAWAAFFLRDQFSKVSRVSSGNPRMIQGARVTPVEFIVDSESRKAATLFVDQQLGVARGASIVSATSAGRNEVIVLAREISIGKEPLQASEFQFDEPAGAQKVEVSAKDADKWYTDLDEALKVAKATNRLVFVDIGTEWCGYCQKMAREVFPTPEFRAQSKYFVFVKLDGDHQRDVVSQFGVEGYPTMIILTKEGKEIHRIVGYRPLDALLAEMNKARSMAG